jgi:ABC-type uncharacterized transport system auxiliary subunit
MAELKREFMLSSLSLLTALLLALAGCGTSSLNADRFEVDPDQFNVNEDSLDLVDDDRFNVDEDQLDLETDVD